MPALLEQLLTSGPVVTDGAWGTQLQVRGLAPGECPDAWNLTHPDLVEQVLVDRGVDFVPGIRRGPNSCRPQEFVRPEITSR